MTWSTTMMGQPMRWNQWHRNRYAPWVAEAGGRRAFATPPLYQDRALALYPVAQRCAPNDTLACKPYGACAATGFCRGYPYVDPTLLYP